MSLTKFNGNTNNIQSLPDKPTLSTTELKSLFDKTGSELKSYINNTLTTEIDSGLENKATSNNVYTKSETNTLLGDKANTSDLVSYKLKSDFAVLSGTAMLSPSIIQHSDPLPTGFTASNSIIVSFLTRSTVNEAGYTAFLSDNYIFIKSTKTTSESVPYKAVLMKIS